MTKRRPKNNPHLDKTQPIFLGIDVHKISWNISLVHCDQLLFRSSIPGNFEDLWKILKKYSDFQVHSVYEAGFSGFHLHFQLEKAGIKNIVTPPNKMPVVVGDRVKTDKRDSLKLAQFLSKGLLRANNIPTQELIEARQLLRTRQQLIKKRVSSINQIKGLLTQFGIYLPKFSKKFLEELKLMKLPPTIKLSLDYHVKNIETLTEQSKILLKEAHQLAQQKHFIENFKILKSTPAIGPLVATALLFEIGDWTRFSNEKKVSAFFGLTPSEYSSGEHTKRGRITGQGNNWLRALLIQVSWKLIQRDGVMKDAFEKIAKQTGSKKKAIVAIARKLVCRLYSMMKSRQEYIIGLEV
jgi:transposase